MTIGPRQERGSESHATAWHPVGMGKRLVRPLRWATAGAFALAVAGAVLPGAVGDAAAGAMIGLLMAVPLLRLAFFVARWWQIGDRRFAVVALLLLVEIGAGAAVALA